LRFAPTVSGTSFAYAAIKEDVPPISQRLIWEVVGEIGVEVGGAVCGGSDGGGGRTLT
jgi:hypothetical protein